MQKPPSSQQKTVALSDIPYQRVGEHAYLYLVSDYLERWKKEKPRSAAGENVVVDNKESSGPFDENSNATTTGRNNESSSSVPTNRDHPLTTQQQRLQQEQQQQDEKDDIVEEAPVLSQTLRRQQQQQQHEEVPKRRQQSGGNKQQEEEELQPPHQVDEAHHFHPSSTSASTSSSRSPLHSSNREGSGDASIEPSGGVEGEGGHSLVHPHHEGAFDKCLVIHLGGTLGMCPNAKGEYEPKSLFLLQKLLTLHELRYPEVPVFDFIEYKELRDSSDMGGATWERVAHDVADFYDDYSGFLIATGTDSLHFLAGALSFALEQLSKPVVCFGSMIPLCELYTDTRRNFTAALRFAGSHQWLSPSVYVFFHEQLFFGTRVLKINDTLQAFGSPNAPPAATIDQLRYVRPNLGFASGVPGGVGSSGLGMSGNGVNLQGFGDPFSVLRGGGGGGGGGGDGHHHPHGAFKMTRAEVVYRTLAATSFITAPLQLRAHFSDRVAMLLVHPDMVLSRMARLLFSAAIVGNAPDPRLASSSVSSSSSSSSSSSRGVGERARKAGGGVGVAFVPGVSATVGSGSSSGALARHRATLPLAIIIKVPEMNSEGSTRLAKSLQHFCSLAANVGCGVFCASAFPENGLSGGTITSLLRYCPDAVPLGDMLAETALVKAMWLLGQNPRPSLDQLRRLMFVSIRGEVTSPGNMLPKPVWNAKL